MTTGEKLRAARKAAGLTQAQTAARLYICRETYALYESSRLGITVGRLMELAKVLGVPAAGLLPDSGDER